MPSRAKPSMYCSRTQVEPANPGTALLPRVPTTTLVILVRSRALPAAAYPHAVSTSRAITRGAARCRSAKARAARQCLG